MQILWNGQDLDVQFQGEQSLAEVLCGLASWLESGGHELVEFCIAMDTAEEDTHTLPPAEQWDFTRFSQPLVGIQQLRLQSVAKNPSLQAPLLVGEVGEVSEALEVLEHFFQLAYNAFESGQLIFLQDLFCDAAGMLELLQRTASSTTSSQPDVAGLQDVLESWGYFQQQAMQLWQDREGERAQVLAVLQGILQWLEQLRRAYRSGDVPQLVQPGQPSHKGRNFADQLRENSSKLEQAILPLQGGQVQAALDYIVELSALLEQLLQLETTNRLHHVFAELSPFLQDLGTAIAGTDIVTIADLVEYEVLPRLHQIIAQLENGSSP